jgi:hypothetical protein
MGKKTLQLSGRFTLDNVKDAVVAQITEGGGELSVFMEGVFVDTQHQGAIQREPFTGFSLRKLPIDAGYGGWTELFEPARCGT